MSEHLHTPDTQPTTTPSGSVTASTQAPQKGQFKYASAIKGINHCPPAIAQAVDVVGFRFAFEDRDHRSNFLPVAVIKPERQITGGHAITSCCEGYSLSVFDSLEHLASRARKVLKTAPRFLQLVGDHFVAIKITATDGLCTSPAQSGHFDFFETETFSGLAAVVAHERLPL